jgi:hypothetical protein
MEIKIVSASLCGLLLSGCNSTKVFDKPVLVDRAELIVPSIQPVSQNNMEWIIITPENFERIHANGNVTYFSLTAKGYQNLSMNVAELRRYIEQQNAVIAAYQKYYKNQQ